MKMTGFTSLLVAAGLLLPLAALLPSLGIYQNTGFGRQILVMQVREALGD